MAGTSENRFSSGGMITKLEAARLATAGAHMILGDGRPNHALHGVVDGTNNWYIFPSPSQPACRPKILYRRQSAKRQPRAY